MATPIAKAMPAARSVKPGDRCEAQFYVGEWYVLQRNSAEAATALKTAVDTCPKTPPAVAELKRLKP